jgi:hypothetical protein
MGRITAHLVKLARPIRINPEARPTTDEPLRSADLVPDRGGRDLTA